MTSNPKKNKEKIMLKITQMSVCALHILLLLLLVTVSGCGPDRQKEHQKPAFSRNQTETYQQITVGINTTIKSVPILLAKELGYFHKEGIQVKIELYPSGVACKEALSSEKINIASVPEILAANDLFTDTSWSIIASINRSQTNQIVARRDHGINAINDLKGKTIGITMKSGAEYWLNRVLIYNHLTLQDVNLVNEKPAALVNILTSGSVDAIIVWHPHAYKAINLLKYNAFQFPVQLDQDMYWLLIGKNDWLAQNNSTLQRFLKALTLSEKFIQENTRQAKIITADFLKVPQDYLDFEWPLHQFKIELPQNLFLSMEEEIRFIMAGKTLSNKPDLKSHFYFDALDAVAPEAISIIH